MTDISYEFYFNLPVTVTVPAKREGEQTYELHLGDLDCEATACISTDRHGGWRVDEYLVRGIKSAKLVNGTPVVVHGQISIDPNGTCWIANALREEWKNNRIRHETAVESILWDLDNDPGIEADYRYEDRISAGLAP